jgi:pilus assembly protein CpaF
MSRSDRLSDRLRKAADPHPPEVPTGGPAIAWSPPGSTAPPGPSAPASAPPQPPPEQAEPPQTTGPTAPRTDPLAGLKHRAQDTLFQRLGARLYDSSLTEDQLRDLVRRELVDVLGAEQMPLSEAELQKLVGLVANDVLGYGPIEEYLADPTVTEVMVNALEPVFVERAGRLYPTDSRFVSEDHLRQVIDRIVSRVGRRIDESSPMVDARLPDGSRVNAIIPPLAVDGPALTIRKFSRRAYTVQDLINFHSLTAEIAEVLSACVRGRLNILVTGGTGSGKTTLLNVLSSFIPEEDRIVTIEDAVELRLNQEHVIRLEARPPNIEGRGEVTIRDLVRNSLRMRPDRIVVGEVRSGEALDMLQAMNTGHDGSLSTLHANTPRDALARLETMVLMAGLDLPVRAIREQSASAVDLIVHMSRLRDGTRRITHVVEVDGMEGEIITLTDLFLYDYSAGMDADGRFVGTVRPTGLRPKFTERLGDLGIEIPPRLFGVDQVMAEIGNGRRR